VAHRRIFYSQSAIILQLLICVGKHVENTDQSLMQVNQWLLGNMVKLHEFLGLNTQAVGCNRSTLMAIEKKYRRLFPLLWLTDRLTDRQDFSNAMPSWYPHHAARARSLHISNYSHVRGLLSLAPHSSFSPPKPTQRCRFCPWAPAISSKSPGCYSQTERGPTKFHEWYLAKGGTILESRRHRQKKRKSWTEGLQGKTREFLQISSHSSCL